MALLPILSFVVFVIALIDIITRDSSQVKHLPKFAWIIIVILLPLIGSVLWFALGREYSGAGQSPVRRVRPQTRAAESFGVPLGQPMRPAPGAELSTEAQLAALEREIEYYEQKAKADRLQAELDARKQRKELE